MLPRSPVCPRRHPSHRKAASWAYLAMQVTRYRKCNGFSYEVPQSLPVVTFAAREGPNAAPAARLSPELAQGVHFRLPGAAGKRRGRPVAPSAVLIATASY